MKAKRAQPRLKRGKRESLWAGLDPAIKAAMRRDALRWNCGMSWIAATALAAFYEIDIPLPYEAKRKGRAA